MIQSDFPLKYSNIDGRGSELIFNNNQRCKKGNIAENQSLI